MIADAWVNEFIAELCKLHPEVLDWASDEIPDIIKQIRGRTSETAKASIS